MNWSTLNRRSDRRSIFWAMRAGAGVSLSFLERPHRKQFMQHEARDCVCPPEAMVCECHHTASLKLINRKVITPAVEEISRNPRSRSAKLRIAERTASRLEWDGIAKRKYNAEENSGSSCQRSSMLKEACGLF